MNEEAHSEQSNNKVDAEALRKKKYSPERLAGLKPYQPGQSGNPGGRPKDILTPLLREYLNANDEAEKIVIVKQLISIAKSPGMRGQVVALKEIWDRIDGKVPDTHKIESDVPIHITFKEIERDV